MRHHFRNLKQMGLVFLMTLKFMLFAMLLLLLLLIVGN